MKYGLLTGLLVLLAGCGGSGGSGMVDEGSQAVDTASSEALIVDAELPIRQRLLSHMQDRYLWFDQLPDIDPADPAYANLRTLIADLRKQPEDRFSAIVNAVSFNSRFEQGLVGSYGIRFFRRQESPLDLRVAMVDDFGTVGLAGIQRGDRIVAAQGTPIDELGLDGFSALFNEPGLGVERTLRIEHPDGRVVDYLISRTEHSLNPVRKSTLLELPDVPARVAYVQVTEFIDLTKIQLDDMRDFLSTENPDELILDLRYNPGGLVSASRDLASSIYGQSNSTDLYTTLTRNEKHRDEDFSYFFRQFENAPQTLSRVFILTTGSTCSASEEVINGLSPFMDVVTIGGTTCGKPYAARPFTLVSEQVIANVLESRSVNADGEGDFFAGLAATCEVADDPLVPFGDAADSLIATALHYIRETECPEPIVLATDQRRRSVSAVSSTDSQLLIDREIVPLAIID